MRAPHRLGLVFALLAACKGTEEAAPSDSGTIPRDVASDVAPDVASDVTPDVASDVAPDVASDVAPDVASDAAPDVASDAAVDAATDARADAPSDGSCVGDGGCFACPSSSAEIINRCTASTCARFDNRARLPRLLADGGLPPLP